MPAALCRVISHIFMLSAYSVITQGWLGGAKPLQKTVLFALFGRLCRPNSAKKGILRGPAAPTPPLAPTRVHYQWRIAICTRCRHPCQQRGIHYLELANAIPAERIFAR